MGARARTHRWLAFAVAAIVAGYGGMVMIVAAVGWDWRPALLATVGCFAVSLGVTIARALR